MAVLKYYNTTTSAWEYIAASTTANFTSWKKTMSGGETSVSGTDDNAVTLSYTAGLEQVFINGVLQVRGSDYTATNGTSVTGLSALVANDIVTVVCYAPFNVANTIAPTVVDAKGDLIVGTAADTVGRLAVGTNNQLLAADSSTASGLKWANGGLTLINTTSFSAVSSVSLPNGTFSATYDNYLIKFNQLVGSTATYASIRMRASGTDYSGTEYRNQQINSFSTTINSARATGMTGWDESIHIGTTWSNDADLTLCNPFVSGVTSAMVRTLFAANGNIEWYQKALGLNTSTSYDSFTLIKTSGNMTGSISVYGYNK